jgi:hypothetical protein
MLLKSWFWHLNALRLTFNLPSIRSARIVRIPITLLSACLLSYASHASEITSDPLQLATQGPIPQPLFERLTADQTGIDFLHRWDPPEESEHILDTAFSGGGVCIGDYDNDGLPDLFFTSPQGGNRLYRNLGGFRFEDVTATAGIDSSRSVRDGAVTWGTGATFVDIENDGDLDLYLCAYDTPNRFYINQGDGTFKEEAKALGLAHKGASIMMAFADIENDGDLDGYLVTYRKVPKGDTRVKKPRLVNGTWTFPEELKQFVDALPTEDGSYRVIKAAQYDYLYRQESNGTFTNITRSAGMSGNYFGHAATWWDYNGDRLPDLYVANDFHGPDQLYRNEGGGTFTDVTADALPHTPWYSMGIDVADINNDGLLDLMGSDMMGTTHYREKVSMGDMEDRAWFLDYPNPRQCMRNAVYVNTGTERFLEVANLTGLSRSDWTWSLKLEDLDNDGFVDLFVANGMTRDWMNTDLRNRTRGLNIWEPLWVNSPKLKEANLAFKNLGDFRFKSVGKEWGLDYVGVSFGAATADLDRDGDLDLVMNNFEEPAGVYRNRSAEANSLLVRLRGRESNREGLGATVRLYTEDGIKVRYMTAARGFMSAGENVMHFGLGQHDRVDRLEVLWPSGHEQRFQDLDLGRLYTITEPDGPSPSIRPPSPPTTLLRKVGTLAHVKHVDPTFDDFEWQLLLPNKLSQLGPGMAWGDVDGDGDDDLYVGGAKGQAGALYVNDGQGGFSMVKQPAFEGDRYCEDLAPLFFDADSDGDLDLYVVSGSVEYRQGDHRLADRLYFNRLEGTFTKARRGELPENGESGGVVVAADYDRDGDLDLFVGGRVIPGQYPLAPRSQLLRNDGGRFTDVADDVAPGLSRTGLVTGALWSDADGDGWIDLLVTHEWGPVKLFGNTNAMLKDRTVAAGLDQRRGWYNSIAGRDIDNDGDIDYVVTNFGLNTKYDASVEKPAELYFGDFAGTGKMTLVEANTSETRGCRLPIRGYSCSQHANPFVAEKLETFHDFASATLSDIYSKEALNKAHRFFANSLESGVLLNDGSGNFKFVALPRLAQVSPGFGIVLTDVDGDCRTDLIMAQNFYGPQLETGRYDGGVGLLLMGKGDGTFEPVWPNRSGLVIEGDATSLTTSDINGDGRMDFVVGVNNGNLMTFERSVATPNRTVAVRLKGRAGNPSGVGSRLTVHFSEDGSRGPASQTAEMHAGSGYLSQSSPVLEFGLGESDRPSFIEVRWPDGFTSSHRLETSEGTIVIIRPSA